MRRLWEGLRAAHILTLVGILVQGLTLVVSGVLLWWIWEERSWLQAVLVVTGVVYAAVVSAVLVARRRHRAGVHASRPPA